jgi:signal transduction histidine kinase
MVDNLLANALKFSPAGGRVVLRADGDLDTARVSVEDQGPGIAPEERERVFRRFHRAPGAAGVPGSGLGLAIARAIAEAHQGRILLGAPRSGSGLLVRVEMPRDPA